ncbi:peroxiredoxin-like family protein [Paenarthrobacter sp. PH39-S1]|uniref:peroxiredoxin-like family protein n=1 Tax=Paenarthrobacter sp. PH39-S1 TaxID=3046204 RepID=UPI0024BA4DCC|nr:peroxiredoxin-like family protein [Paenarthrobacter sp. PH39-S1]MDJ0357795.1 peroxiredoxin-like family protein [Paenarthrobacter sp. PH39-S1]
MTLHPTQTAPTLSLPLTGGGSTDELALGSGAGGRFSLVVFFRGLHCPVCRKQLGELDRRLVDLNDAGVGRVLAVSMETPERSAQLVEQWHLRNLPVACGLTEASAREWGLFISTAIKDGEAPVFNEPGMFVLDADGTLFWSSVSSMPFGRPAIDDVLAGLQFAQKSEYPARGAA